MSRQAKSLDQFLKEINAFAPNRDKRSDGGLASSTHHLQNPTSDHEPNSNGVWTARDTTNDVQGSGPVGGDDLPGQFLANKLDEKFGKHPAMMEGSYIIFNGRIKSYNRRKEGWRPYPGPNSHKTHVHLSVSDAVNGYDSTQAWNLFDRKPNAVERMRSHLVQAIHDGRAAKSTRAVVKNGVKDLVDLLEVLPLK